MQREGCVTDVQQEGCVTDLQQEGCVTDLQQAYTQTETKSKLVKGTRLWRRTQVSITWVYIIIL